MLAEIEHQEQRLNESTVNFNKISKDISPKAREIMVIVQQRTKELLARGKKALRLIQEIEDLELQKLFIQKIQKYLREDHSSGSD